MTTVARDFHSAGGILATLTTISLSVHDFAAAGWVGATLDFDVIHGCALGTFSPTFESL
jgi:hypothetical protein